MDFLVQVGCCFPLNLPTGILYSDDLIPDVAESKYVVESGK